jgi:hypothetical protein
MRSMVVTLVIALFLSTAILVQQAKADESADAKRAFEKKCTACHSLSRITSRTNTAEKWAKVVDKMKRRAEKKDESIRISDGEAKTITDYLAEQHGK